VSTIWGIRPYVDRELVDVIQPDRGRAGGITQMRKMATMAESHYITMAFHSRSLGPVAGFTAPDVMATIPNALVLERLEIDWQGRYDVVRPVLRVEDGAEECAKYPGRRNVADLPPDDSWSCEPVKWPRQYTSRHGCAAVRAFRLTGQESPREDHPLAQLHVPRRQPAAGYRRHRHR